MAELTVIPYQAIDAQTLGRLVESFILREGTDYGAGGEISLEAKVGQVMRQIEKGKVEVVYSEEDDTFSLRTKP